MKTTSLWEKIRTTAAGTLPFVLLAALAVGLYLPSLGGDFVYDSRLQILTDSFIHTPSHWRDVLTLRVMGMDVLDFNRPVQLASLMTDAAIWGRDPFGYRLTNLLLHALNGCLLFAVLRGLPESNGAEQTRDRWGFWLAVMLSALFLVHPLAVEVVCEPSNREDLLATTFILAAVLGVLRVTRSGEGWLAMSGIMGFTFLAIGGKETGIAAPAVISTLVFFFPGKSSLRQRIVLGVVPWLIVAAFLAVRFVAEPSGSVIFASKPTYPGGSLSSALALQPRIFALYWVNIFHPTNLCADYGLYSVRDLPLSLSLWIMGLTVAGLAAGCWKDRRIVVATAGMLASLLPVSNLVPIYRAAADRFLYLPLVFVAFIPFCLLNTKEIRRRASLQILVLVLGSAGILLLVGINKATQSIWRTPESLWAACMERNPAAMSGQVGMADALLQNRNWTKAKTHYLNCLEMPGGRNRADVWAGLALCDDATGDGTAARAAAVEAVRLDPYYSTEEKMLLGLRAEKNFAKMFSGLLLKYQVVPPSPKGVASP